MPETEPTLKFITNLRRELEDNQWSRAREAWREVEVILHHETQVEKITGDETYHSPKGNAKIQAMVDTIITSAPKITRNSKSTSEASIQRDDKLVKMAKALLVVSEHKGILPPFNQGAFNLASYGYTNMGLRINMKHFPQRAFAGKGKKKFLAQREKVRMQEEPFWIDCGHPSWVLLPPGEVEPPFALEIQVRKAYDVEREFGVKLEGTTPWQDVEVLVYTSKEYRAVVMGAELGGVTENGWGFVPHVQGFAGFGFPRMVARGGTSTTGNSYGYRSEDLAVSLIRTAHDALRDRDTLMTALRRLAMKAAYQLEIVGGGEDAVDIAVQRATGGIVQVNDVNNIKWEEIPEASRTFMEALRIIDGDIDDATFVGVVQGERTPGVTTASQHLAQLGAARLRFGTAMGKLNQMAEILLKQVLQVIEIADESAMIGGVLVEPEDIQGNYKFNVQFAEGDEESNLRKIDTGLRLFQAKAIGSRDLLQKWVGEEDVEQAMENLDTEETLRSPAIQERKLALVDAIIKGKYPEVVLPGEAPKAPPPLGQGGMSGNGQMPVAPATAPGLGGMGVPPVTQPNPLQEMVRPGSAEEKALAMSQLRQGGGQGG